MSAVAILVARGGSVRISRKNVKLFAGMPMIFYPLKSAQESGLFNAIYVSTEDEEIAAISRGFGAMMLMRSEKYARDEIGTQEVMRDALLTLADARQTFDYACCIYPCAPMMTPCDLQMGFNCLQNDAWGDYAYMPGWYYWGYTKAFLDGVPLDPLDDIAAPENRWIDINTESDWQTAEKMYAALHPEVA